ncbi:MAG: proline--tRNA ligase [Thermodesulfobacteriota bacterium]|nr:proline--tRNA ligase [Thermodesulfobacteriota bacterium]
MRLSSFYAPTLKEAPADAEVISHRLLLRAGMVRKLTSGIYTFLPLGLRALNKVAQIVREEMNKAGAQEIFMPSVQPGDLWEETGRWDVYGKELLRFTDRHGRDYCLGPTHEEVVTDLIRGEVRSYRQLPLNLYQIQTKFRDEIRPRFGLMRSREFMMKDGYSFDADEKGANTTYAAMYKAYEAIFSRLGMRFRAVEADSGPIGGSFSHEFMVLAETGEDMIAVCGECEYAANLEKAEVAAGKGGTSLECPRAEEVATPDMHTVDEVASYLKVGPEKIIKTLLYEADGEIVAVLVRGDRELNEVKFRNLLGVKYLSLAFPEKVLACSGGPVGFSGPVGLKVKRVFADQELSEGTDYITGANKDNTHLLHVDLERDARLTGFYDLRVAAQGDVCPRCGGTLKLTRGIEVGHVFKLGVKYSEAMNAGFLDKSGMEQPMVMGCYGIGVSRIIAANIEQNHDENGIIFPPPLAPFEVLILSLNSKDKAVYAKSEEIYAALKLLGVDTLWDDREERPGVKFKDADLMGMPMQLVVGGKGLKRGVVEAKDRRTGERIELAADNFEQDFTAWQKQVFAGWNL